MGAKPTRCAVAAVVRRPDDGRSFLAVRRPPDDDHLPDVWGLPAVTLQPGELPEEGLRRLGREKLATELEPRRFVGIKAAEREAYQLILMEIEAVLMGREPDVASAAATGTRYVDLRWTADPTLLSEAARRGSLCAQLLLESARLPSQGPEP